MDSPRERLLAAALGGFGTVIALLAYQGIPDLLRLDFLVLRTTNGLLFLLAVFLIGCAGGWVGHWMFLYVAKGTFEIRALVVGGIMGSAIALAGWGLTNTFSGVFFPFRFYDGMQSLLDQWLRNALIAGPSVAIGVSLLVARRLRSAGITSKNRSRSRP